MAECGESGFEDLRARGHTLAVALTNDLRRRLPDDDAYTAALLGAFDAMEALVWPERSMSRVHGLRREREPAIDAALALAGRRHAERLADYVGQTVADEQDQREVLLGAYRHLDITTRLVRGMAPWPTDEATFTDPN